MDGTEWLVRGQRVLNTGSPITVPVGRATLSRIINVIGKSIDEKGEIKIDHFLPIHREAPSFVYQPTLATDLGGPQERITTTKKGSITSVQAIYMPLMKMSSLRITKNPF